LTKRLSCLILTRSYMLSNITSDIEQLGNLATSQALKGDWETAIRLNKQIVKSDQNNIDALNRLGHAYTEVGMVTEAVTIYRKVLRVDPYNSIANKNLRRLRTIKGKLRGKTKTDKSAVQTIRGSSLVNLFLEVPGKTATVSLTEIAEPRTLALINCADRIYLKPKKHQITLNSDDGTYLGKLPDILAARLIKLIKGGNQYEAYVKGVTDEQIKVFLKEVKRAKRLVNVNSFPIDDRTLYVAFTPPDLVHGEMPESRTLEDQAEDGSEDDESGSNRED